MNLEIATLLAAIIAALTSLVVLLLGFATSNTAASKAAYRTSVEKYLPELSTAIHSVVATGSIILKTKSTSALTNWRNKGKKANHTYKRVNREVKYPLLCKDVAQTTY